MDVWDAIADGAASESRLWADALLPSAQRELRAVFSPLAAERFRLGLETIYEGYLVHYGRPRLFAPPDDDTALLLGDYLYAHGLVRVAQVDPVAAVGNLAQLISLCAQLRADGTPGDGAAWAATAATLGGDTAALEHGRAELRLNRNPEPLLGVARRAAADEGVELALAAHEARLR